MPDVGLYCSGIRLGLGSEAYTVSPLVTMEHIILGHHMSIDDYLLQERYMMMAYHVTIDRH